MRKSFPLAAIVGVLLCAVWAPRPAAAGELEELDAAISAVQGLIQKLIADIGELDRRIAAREQENQTLQDKMGLFRVDLEGLRPTEREIARLTREIDALKKRIPSAKNVADLERRVRKHMYGGEIARLKAKKKELAKHEATKDEKMRKISDRILKDTELTALKINEIEDLQQEVTHRLRDPQLITLRFQKQQKQEELGKRRFEEARLQNRRKRLLSGVPAPGTRFLLGWQLPTRTAAVDVPLPDETRHSRWYGGNVRIVRVDPDDPHVQAYFDLLGPPAGGGPDAILGKFMKVAEAFGGLMDRSRRADFAAGPIRNVNGPCLLRVDCGGQVRYRFVNCVNGSVRALGGLLFLGLKPGAHKATLTLAAAGGQRMASTKVVNVKHTPKVIHVWTPTKIEPSGDAKADAKKPKGIYMPVTVTLAYARGRAAAVGQEQRERWSRIDKPRKTKQPTSRPKDGKSGNEAYGVPTGREGLIGDAYFPSTPETIEMAKYSIRQDSIKKFLDVYDLLKDLPGCTPADLDPLLKEMADVTVYLFGGRHWKREDCNPFKYIYVLSAGCHESGTEQAYSTLKSVAERVKTFPGMKPEKKGSYCSLLYNSLANISINQRKWARAVEDLKMAWAIRAATQPDKYKADQPPKWWPTPKQLEALAKQLDGQSK